MRVSLALLVTLPLLAVGSGARAEEKRDLPTNGPIAALGQRGVYLLDGRGGAKRLVRGTAKADDYQWSLDGRRLVFDTGAGDNGYWTKSDVFKVGVEGSELIAEDAWSPSWLPDASGLVLMREVATPHKVPGLPVWDDWNVVTYAVGADGSNPRRLTSVVEAGDDAFALSPDGKWIAYSSHGVNRVGVDGSRREPIVSDKAVSELAWSPDGDWLAFVADEEGYLVRADGTGLRRLARSGDPLAYLAWSPDGSTIAAERFPNGPPWGELVLIDVASGKESPLIRRPLTGFDAAWSPDGEQLVFAALDEDGWVCGSPESDREGDLWVTKVDGSDLRRLAKGCWAKPSWLPAAAALSPRPKFTGN